MYWLRQRTSTAQPQGTFVQLDLICPWVSDLPMPHDHLTTRLRGAFHPPAASHMDATFALDLGQDRVTFRVRHGKLDFVEGLAADATFYFDTPDQALQLLTGDADVFEAFMEGRFRADGYLMWTFALLTMFRGRGAEPSPPG